MNLDAAVEARIHPAIGIARVGNSQEYFIGPEIASPVAPPQGGYHDQSGRLKRQAARFRIYGYDRKGRMLAANFCERRNLGPRRQQEGRMVRDYRMS